VTTAQPRPGGPATVRSATRRLFALTGLRWLPIGFAAPVTVLLAQERGLSLPQVGGLFVLYGVLVTALELPTGGLADVVGRRAVVVAGGLLHVVAFVLLVIAQDLGGFVAAYVAHAVGRALDSGPLEAWYVDTVRRLDPDADVAAGLGWQGAADGGSLAVGAVLGGLLPSVVAGEGADALVIPVAVAAGLEVGYVLAVLRLVREPRPPRSGSALRGLRRGVEEVPATVVGALRLSAVDPTLRLVLLVTCLGGVGIAAVELLGPGRSAELAGSPEAGAALFGAVLALSFAASALGSVAAARARRLARGSTRVACALATGLGAVGLAGFAGFDVVLPAGAGVALFYLAHGVVWPLLSSVLHGLVGEQQRSTMVSAMSLSMMAGGTAASLALPRLAERAGASAALAVTAVVVVATALLCLRLPPRGPAGSGRADEEALLDQPGDDGQHLLGGLTGPEPGGGRDHVDQLTEPPLAVAAGQQRGAVQVDPARPPQP
jgi:MFS family permease